MAVYVNAHTKVKIICPVHGLFEQIPNSHLRGRGCPKCKVDNIRKKISHTQEDFIENAKKAHGDRYDYSKVNYINCKSKVCIICPKYGEFWQIPDDHVRGKGVKCVGKNVSEPEMEIKKYIEVLGYEVQGNTRQKIAPYELDIFIPSLKKAIEFNGEYWHYNHSNPNCKPKGYHAMKSNLCRDKGIKLLHVREDLWRKDKEKMKKVIFKFLNL